MGNIIDKIRLSGVTYTLSGQSSGSPTVELTQAQYDALVSAGTVSADTYYIITDSQAGGLSNYWTSAETQSAITEATSGKLDTSVCEAYSGSVDTALGNKQDTSGMTAYTENTAFTAHTGDSTIHVTSTDKSNWNAKSDFSGSYNDLTDKPTIPTVPTSNTAFTNDAGYITSGDAQSQIDNSISGKADNSAVTEVSDSLSGYVYTADIDKQDIFGKKTFVGAKRLNFTQASSSDKLGFTLYDVRDGQGNAKEFGAFELNPTGITENSVTHPLLTLNQYRQNSNIGGRDVQTYLGYRQYDQPNSAAYHLLVPLPENAKTPFNLTTTFQNYYLPLGFKNGSTMIKADNTGVVDLSSELGGLKLVKLTQIEYDNLATKDSNTLYVIVN